MAGAKRARVNYVVTCDRRSPRGRFQPGGKSLSRVFMTGPKLGSKSAIFTCVIVSRQPNWGQNFRQRCRNSTLKKFRRCLALSVFLFWFVAAAKSLLSEGFLHICKSQINQTSPELFADGGCRTLTPPLTDACMRRPVIGLTAVAPEP